MYSRGRVTSNVSDRPSLEDAQEEGNTHTHTHTDAPAEPLSFGSPYPDPFITQLCSSILQDQLLGLPSCRRGKQTAGGGVRQKRQTGVSSYLDWSSGRGGRHVEVLNRTQLPFALNQTQAAKQGRSQSKSSSFLSRVARRHSRSCDGRTFGPQSVRKVQERWCCCPHAALRDGRGCRREPAICNRPLLVRLR